MVGIMSLGLDFVNKRETRMDLLKKVLDHFSLTSLLCSAPASSAAFTRHLNNGCYFVGLQGIGSQIGGNEKYSEGLWLI
jgi:hypothetical protein